ncbi:MAG: phosphopantetheine-binding protein [Terrimicrobiaceae bacterium]
MNPANKQEEADAIRRAFPYHSPETLEAILKFRLEGDSSVVPIIVFGIIEREATAKSAEALASATEDSRFLEDLGIDSLTMLEIVLGIEEALNVKIEDSELRGILTIGDVNRFLAGKLKDPGGRSPAQTTPSQSIHFSKEQVLAILPQQPPFLFIDQATLEGEIILAEYLVRGDEDCLKGHFRDNPIFPASLVFEALGQAGCLWILTSEKTAASRPGVAEILFASMGEAHFHSKVRAGESLEIRVELGKLRTSVAIFKGRVSSQGRMVATVERLMLAFGDMPDAPTYEDDIPAL